MWMEDVNPEETSPFEVFKNKISIKQLVTTHSDGFDYTCRIVADDLINGEQDEYFNLGIQNIILRSTDCKILVFHKITASS
jgi:hypothetical protein